MRPEAFARPMSFCYTLTLSIIDSLGLDIVENYLGHLAQSMSAGMGNECGLLWSDQQLLSGTLPPTSIALRLYGW